MPGSVGELSLDEQRLAFDERKWGDEVAFRQAEAAAKAKENSWWARIFSPLTATLFAGVLTIAGSVTATVVQNFYAQKLERQKEQHELIVKMVTGTDEAQSRKNLDFLADVGLVDEETAKKIRSAKTVPVIPALGRLASIGAPPAPEELRRLLSDDAMQTLLSFELVNKATYDRSYLHPNWQGGAFGIVIGISYDLGLVTAEQFETDWKPYLPQSDLEALKLAVGVRGPAAQAQVANLAGVTVSWEKAVAVFYAGLWKWSALLDRSLPNARELPPESYGALVSLLYNRGGSFDQQGNRYLEMRKIRELMTARQFDAIPTQIRSMKRLWPNMQGLQIRREEEAKLFEKGFQPH